MLKNTVPRLTSEVVSIENVAVEERSNRCKTAVKQVVEETRRLEEQPKQSNWFNEELNRATGSRKQLMRKIVLIINDTKTQQETPRKYKEKRREEKRLHKQKKKNILINN